MSAAGHSPDSIASRAIAHLKSLGAGGEAAVAVIAEAIGCDSSAISDSLFHHVGTGRVAIRKEGRLNFYRIGNGTKPTVRSADPDEDPPDPDDLPRQRLIRGAKVEAPVGARNSVFDNGALPPAPPLWPLPSQSGGRRRRSAAR